MKNSNQLVINQKQLINYLVNGINSGKKYQTLLGVTGSR